MLADETVLAHLAERGFTVISEPDPVRLRGDIAQFGAFTTQRPLIIITPHPLNQLPYDLWQQGHPVTLALHTFFPTLAYPVIQTLTPNQRWRLSQLPLPAHLLGRQGSIDFILRHLFGVVWEGLATPAGLIAWLNQYHQGETMPALLAKQWLAKVQLLNPTYPEWPLAEWLHNRATFQAFVTQEWQQYVATSTEKGMGETKPTYQLPFADDAQLQDTLPQLVRSGAIQPVTLTDATPLPAWAQSGVRTSAADFARQRVAVLLATVAEQAAALTGARWAEWQATATTWAELTAWRYDPQRYLTEKQRAAYAQWQAQLDADFTAWLQQRYAPLAGQRLPQPHHLFHVPHWMAYQRRRQDLPAGSAARTGWYVPGRLEHHCPRLAQTQSHLADGRNVGTGTNSVVNSRFPPGIGEWGTAIQLRPYPHPQPAGKAAVGHLLDQGKHPGHGLRLCSSPAT